MINIANRIYSESDILRGDFDKMLKDMASKVNSYGVKDSLLSAITERFIRYAGVNHDVARRFCDEWEESEPKFPAISDFTKWMIKNNYRYKSVGGNCNLCKKTPGYAFGCNPDSKEQADRIGYMYFCSCHKGNILRSRNYDFEKSETISQATNRGILFE